MMAHSKLFKEPVRALHVFDDGSGTALYASGEGVAGPNGPINHVLKWNGENWSFMTYDHFFNWHVLVLATIELNGSPTLAAGGAFGEGEGEVYETFVATWDGTQWRPYTTGLMKIGDSSIPAVHAIISFDDGSGPMLFVGGSFTHAGELEVSNLARWDGKAWTTAGQGSSARVTSFAVYDDGTSVGPSLYASGSFASTDGTRSGKVARWNGSSWDPIGTGTQLIGSVHSMIVHNDGTGTGPTLFIAGTFAGNDEVLRLVGNEWIGVGEASWHIQSLATFDDGTGDGPALYVGGGFSTMNGITARGIAKWDGEAWHALGPGVAIAGNSTTRAMTSWSDQAGPVLVVGGDFFCLATLDWNITSWRGCAVACPADLVTNATFQPPGDGQVDGADLAYLLADWGAVSGGRTPADIVTSRTLAPPPDSIVNGADLAYLLGAWGPCD